MVKVLNLVGLAWRARLKSVCERRERATQQYLRRLYNKIKYKAQPK